ncbi:MAG: RluA family pseudouridine synthase [Dethiobacter sp.]|jgi:23S rRNA pseudouridine1911/1915/1917 synthase|nr:RluA family pseudouridine synthase [Dethiobacter sp.]MBS3900888.1 RluA family pseudouridine synthase [Dethiobacter sp.]MBS3990386.1 RluA family pseudouridine synthase [Dethiobacter sp.]
MKTNSFSVTESLSGERLDAVAAKLADNLSRSRVQKLIEQSLVLVDGVPQKANYRLRTGQLVEISLPDVTPTVVAAEEIALNILYEDEDLLVIDKPKGLVVHPAAGHLSGTLVNALLYHCDDLSGISGEARPGIVHRLDKDTSGVLLVAKNDRAHRNLSEQFKEHSITREYVAIVQGNVALASGSIDAPIARHPRERKKMSVAPASKGRRAVTHFSVLEQFDGYTYLACSLETGRTHQIRVHLASIGHPVVGDPLYGYKRKQVKLAGQALHARLLGFIHPTSGVPLEFCSDPPAEFVELLGALREKRGKEGDLL